MDFIWIIGTGIFLILAANSSMEDDEKEIKRIVKEALEESNR